MFNPRFTGPTLQDFPWDRGIVEETQRGIDAVTDRLMPSRYCETHPLLSSGHYVCVLYVVCTTKYQLLNEHIKRY